MIEMVSVVEQILELHKASPRTPQDKERVRRVPGKPPGIIKIESTDKAIDRLVSPAETSRSMSRKGDDKWVE